MSTDAGLSNDVTIEDEDGVVDREVKKHVLSLRRQVDDDERSIYVEMVSDPAYDLTVDSANEFWGISVRQYLRGIKRLWGKEEKTDVRNVEKYWKKVNLGTEKLIPHDYAGYQFSLVAHADQYNDNELKRAIGLPRKADLPKPKKEEFKGLNSILSQNRIEASWVVQTKMTGPPPEHQSVTLHVEEPIPKHILENAVEAADTFLQQAGLGFEVGVPAYYGDNGPGL